MVWGRAGGGSRRNTLNGHADRCHRAVPPNYKADVHELQSRKCEITVAYMPGEFLNLKYNLSQKFELA